MRKASVCGSLEGRVSISIHFTFSVSSALEELSASGHHHFTRFTVVADRYGLWGIFLSQALYIVIWSPRSSPADGNARCFDDRRRRQRPQHTGLALPPNGFECAQLGCRDPLTPRRWSAGHHFFLLFHHHRRHHRRRHHHHQHKAYDIPSIIARINESPFPLHLSLPFPFFHLLQTIQKRTYENREQNGMLNVECRIQHVLLC